MSFDAHLQNEFVNAREVSSVYTKSPPVADDTSPSVSISTPDNLEVILSGFSDGTGSVTLIGTDPVDAAINETITFPGNGQKISNLEFKTISRITTSGLVGEATEGTLMVKTATGSGTDQPVWSTIGPFMGRLIRPKSAEAFHLLGERGDKRGAIFTVPGEDVVIGDRIKFGPEEWEAEEIRRRFGPYGEVHHWQITIIELESPAN